MDQEKKDQFFVVATPIGNLSDITSRALDIFKMVDRIYCEDTRHSQKLMVHFAIDTPLRSLHEHNEKQRVEEVLNFLKQGCRAALISDAGTPLISDPGYVIVRELRKAGVHVVTVPGASAVIAALSVAGVATDSFIFAGFLSAKAQERRRQLQSFATELRTIVFYESCHRILTCVKDLIHIMPNRNMVLCKELTKQFESVISGSPADIANWLEEDTKHQCGEFVLILDKDLTSQISETITTTIDDMIGYLQPYMPVSDLARLLAKLSGGKRQELYQRCMEYEKKYESN